ncbi:DUF2528 family protein [Serratia marcescens]|uniref:DUF2528 family protein n=1 Tax=Serratia TaxID=613 RepID=UPI002177BA65|nr:DUF2528 family protein [Serratia ficaria]CAI1063189.1 Protein of uncharacterised function (DUF2528) [Serratia ficaria]CAI1783047.1 Protein of uncharacterised function (DUF2528) [Serratia ficaria]CAI2408015.1 Protein of uncharacterised function (DUF2528) [Serratia ficaria]CAI2515237.1 Protein of uncharacterised function (DUF2528) [Serratia ficaria]CAI2792737.1 Protein of uncharacterised function (DUF2528) [Serratia ficaria]
MTAIKQYEITWNAHEDAPVLTVEIDHDICTYEHLHQINNFFIGHKHRLSDNDGDITVTVLKMLAAECFVQQVSEGWNAYGLICQFKDGNNEGWPPMDGSNGIKIISCDVPGVNWDDMEVSW